MSETNTARLAVTETEAAKAIGMSVYFLQRDRIGKRLIPFYRIGNQVRYNLDRVREALDALEEGGTHLKPRRRKALA
ncbi:hypothetical protein [Cupriavidus metallidurans]|uniref:hypothetical protein n=1 Tax=Cupriavidus metallidurans TaxID=119219 RepID=UPI000763B0B2|nr:hypothetical protein [Cupriavidus metallidurans]KWW37658.1 hypothetical protein AU374_01425 [Cupriavidus metallidurans]